jgi:HK97 family phage prohead protease
MRTTQRLPPTAGTIRKAVFPTIVADVAKGEGLGFDGPSIVISTAALDRQGDVLVSEGCDLTGYQRNPVVLFGHDSSELPVGVTTSISMEPTGLRASWRWLENDERANRVRNAWNQGALRAASVGFRPLDYEDTDTGYKFSRWELIEWSLTPTPANAEALRVLKGLGLDSDVPMKRLSPADRLLRRNGDGAAILKQGRVLSAQNEQRIRDAKDLLTDVTALLEDVLAQLEPAADDGKAVLNLDDELPVSRRVARRHGAGDRVGQTVDGIELDAELVRNTTKRVVNDVIMRLTGKVD